MSAFVNGALSALNKISEFLDTLDPTKEDKFLNHFRDVVALYERMYSEIDTRPEVVDKTWDNIKKADEQSAESDEIVKIIHKIFEA